MLYAPRNNLAGSVPATNPIALRFQNQALPHTNSLSGPTGGQPFSPQEVTTSKDVFAMQH